MSHTHEGNVYSDGSADYSVRPLYDGIRVTPIHNIIVENVPDDEDDELKEMHSVWRNRIPSPGQWMEPVESFGEDKRRRSV